MVVDWMELGEELLIFVGYELGYVVLFEKEGVKLNVFEIEFVIYGVSIMVVFILGDYCYFVIGDGKGGGRLIFNLM